MNSQLTNTKAVSPVLAVILLVSVTVLLSTAIGVLVLDLGQTTTTQEPSNLGVTITEHEPGTVSINTKTGSTDSLRVLVNGEERVNQSVTPGEHIELTGVTEDARISIIDSSGSSDKVVVSQEVSNGIPFATAPADVASIHANMSTNESGVLIITNVYELQAMNHDLSADYVLGNDIQASSTQYWNGGDGFDPVGEEFNNAFTGSLDGDGYEVDGLYINRSNTDNVGLIGYSKGSVSNLGVVNADVSGDDYVGGLIGYNYKGTVTSSYSTGSVTGNRVGGLVGINGGGGTVTSSYSTGSVSSEYGDYVGGLVGKNTGDVTSSYSTGDVSSESGDYVGGLVGYNDDGSTVEYSYSMGSVSSESGNFVGGLVGHNRGDVKKSYSTGDVTSNGRVGGLIGENFGGTVTSSYSTGSVTGDDDVGGLAGYNGGTVTSSYSTGSVTGDDDVGGLVGNTKFGTVEYSYSTGSVTGNESIGGLIGDNFGDNGEVTSSYWDTESSEQSFSYGGDGLSTSEMTGPSAKENMSGFEFGTTWSIGASDEYPELAWEE